MTLHSTSFRPLAGIMVLIAGRSGRDVKSMKGFRPLAGIMVLIGTDCALIFYQRALFPSPCGDYGSYRPLPLLVRLVPSCFRPLAGIMVLIIKNGVGDHLIVFIIWRPLELIFVLIF